VAEGLGGLLGLVEFGGFQLQLGFGGLQEGVEGGELAGELLDFGF
jgi:hypothetical protein